LGEEFSVVVLAGGQARRFGGVDKALLEICGRPMISYVLDVASSLSPDVVVVVSSDEQVKALSKLIRPEKADVVIDEGELGPRCPLLGLITGLKAVEHEKALALACDMPLASKAVLSFLAEVMSYMNASVPRWPNGYVEPLQAAYRTGKAIRAGEAVLKSGGDITMRSFLKELGRVRYVSTNVLEQLDPGLRTFTNVNTPADARKAELALRARGLC